MPQQTKDFCAHVQTIASRMRDDGATLQDVKREIDEGMPLDDAQRGALWLYAASRPESLRAAQPFGGLGGRTQPR